MDYINYIKLGFVRENANDEVVFKRTGYHGFYLQYRINKAMILFVSSDRLDKPHLLINRSKNYVEWHDITIAEVEQICRATKRK